MVSAKDTGSPEVARAPVTSGRMISRSAPTSLATTVKPLAMASTGLSGVTSWQTRSLVRGTTNRSSSAWYRRSPGIRPPRGEDRGPGQAELPGLPFQCRPLRAVADDQRPDRDTAAAQFGHGGQQ